MRVLGRAALVLGAAAVLWIAAVLLLDERPDAAVERSLQRPGADFSDRGDAAILLTGLSAPADRDAFEFGQFISRTVYGPESRARPWEELRREVEPPDSLRLSTDSKELECWLDDTLGPRSYCASADQLAALLSANGRIIARYRAAYELSRFGRMAHNVAMLIGVNKLLAAEIRLDLQRGGTADAFEKWAANHAFLSRALQGTNSWVEKAVLIVCQNYSLGSAEAVLRSARELPAQRFERVRELLGHRGLAAYNLDGAMQAEYELMSSVFAPGRELKFWVHPNFVRNRLHRYVAEAAGAKATPYREIEALAEQLKARHVQGWSSDYLTDPLNTLFARALLGGQVKALEMVKQMYLAEGAKALLVLQAEIAHRKIADADIPRLLGEAPPALRSPVDAAAMGWDAAKRTLYFTIDGEHPAREVRL